MAEQQSTNSSLRRVIRTITATPIGKCSNCGGPGVYNTHESIQAGWPGCWVPAGDPLQNQSVGEVCPNCGERRQPPEDAREIGRMDLGSW